MSSINRILLSGCLEKRKEKKTQKSTKYPIWRPFFLDAKVKFMQILECLFLGIKTM